MTTHMTCWCAPVLALTLAGWAAGFTAASPLRAEPQSSPDGAQLYRTYCASCHGASARGDGPMADVLRRRPSDLTEIRRRYRGFPTDLLMQIIDGRHPVRGHGAIDMPVWGDAFRSGDAPDEPQVRDRVRALVQYLEAIQARNTD
jgi:hypothetical protein